MPTLNEQESIGKTITNIPKKEILDLGYEVELIIVDGNSNDNTRKVASSLGAEVILESKTGYGVACKIGLNAAKGELVVILDGDATYPGELIPQYLKELNRNNLDFISVNRFSNSQKGAMSLSHRIGNKILSIAMRLLYRVHVNDSQSGMWIMTKAFVNAVHLRSNSMSLSEEIKIIAFTYFKSLEVEGRFYKRIGTAKIQTFSDGWENFSYLFKFKRYIKSVLIENKAVTDECN